MLHSLKWLSPSYIATGDDRTVSSYRAWTCFHWYNGEIHIVFNRRSIRPLVKKPLRIVVERGLLRTAIVVLYTLCWHSILAIIWTGLLLQCDLHLAQIFSLQDFKIRLQCWDTLKCDSDPKKVAESSVPVCLQQHFVSISSGKSLIYCFFGFSSIYLCVIVLCKILL